MAVGHVSVYQESISMVVETFNPEKIGRKACFTPIEAPFFIETSSQILCREIILWLSKILYNPFIPIIMTKYFCHWNYTVAAANNLS